MRLLAHHSGDERLTRDLQDDALYEEVTEAIGLDREEDRGRVKQALLAMLNGQGASARDRLLSGRGARLEHGFKTRWTGAWGFLQNLQMACRAMGWQVVTSDGTVARMPMGKRAEYKAPAGYLQATEADALRKVIKGAEELELRLPVTLVLTVHDETVWLVHDPSRVEECADAIKELMEQALHISPELTQGSVSVSWGPSWGQQDGSKEPPEPPPEPEQDEVLSKTLARLEELHGLNGVCPSPIRLDIEKDGEPVAVLAPCKGYLCPVCGPRQVAAVRAAIEVIVEDWTGEGEWSAALALMPSNPTARSSRLRALRRWRSNDPGGRMYPSVATTPEKETALLLWKGDKAPPGVYELVDDPAVAAGELASQIDLEAWMFHPGKTTILRGERDARSGISQLRDHVLGRPRQTDTEATPALVTQGVPEEKIIEAVETVLGPKADVRIEKVWADNHAGRSLRRYVSSTHTKGQIIDALREVRSRGLVHDLRDGDMVRPLPVQPLDLDLKSLGV